MIRETLQAGDPRLKAHCSDVRNCKSSKVEQIIQDLIDSMRSNQLIGMAAPQIGENRRIFVTEPRETETRIGNQIDELRIYINPQIIESSEKQGVIWEGCGSFARSTIFGPVMRPQEITVEAQDATGKTFQLVCDGILARVIQHENDHLNGIEFIEKVTDIKELIDRDIFLKKIKNSPNQLNNSIITKKEFKFV